MPVKMHEAFAKRLHEEYEKAANELGWETNAKCRGKTWEELPKKNRATMVAACEAAFRHFTQKPKGSGLGIMLTFSFDELGRSLPKDE